jgi:predicted metalloprotease with PDZ domain
LFASDDPWLKEGVTSYYGDVLTAQAGWLNIEQIQKWILRYTYMVHGTTEIERVKLSDPRLWYEEYTNEAWRRVTYERGCAVAMRLDLLLRQETENARSLDDVMKVLYAEHLHESFDRLELLAAIKKATGVEAAKFFADYVDSAYLPTTEEAQETLTSLIELGVYDPR